MHIDDNEPQAASAESAESEAPESSAPENSSPKNGDAAADPATETQAAAPKAAAPRQAREQERSRDVESPSVEGESEEFVPGRRFSGIDRLLMVDIPSRVEGAEEKLKATLRGTIALELYDVGKELRYDFVGGGAKVEEGRDLKADCRIRISKGHLEKVASGKLNPQIAMLSDKILVSGRAELAVYFFNLVV